MNIELKIVTLDPAFFATRDKAIRTKSGWIVGNPGYYEIATYKDFKACSALRPASFYLTEARRFIENFEELGLSQYPRDIY